MVVTGSGLIIDDRYRLDEQIAAGGVGQVWRATDLLLERPVAVKVLRPEYADHPDTLERFRKEARHAGALSHPRVAQVYDFGHGGSTGSPYLVMEFVDGPSLADLLLDSPADPVFALDVIAQAADGLSAAHREGLVHRDVKPGNILIGPEGRVKLTDFGIAHAVGQTPVTDPALVMGTSQYLAPERIAGGPGTPASDLYSLGIVLHECLTGMPPYDGTAAEVMASHLYLPLPPLPAAVPPELDVLVAQLTAKDPARRIRGARELAGLASRLRDAIAAGAALPGPAAPSPAVPSPGGPHLAAPSFGSPSLAGPNFAGEPTAPPYPPGPPGGLLLEGAGARPEATARRRQRRAAVLLGAGAIALAGGGLASLLLTGAIGTPAAKSPPASSPAHGTGPGSTSASAAGGGVSVPSATTPGTPGRHARHGKSGKTATPSPSGSATASPGGSPTPSPSSPGTPTTSPQDTTPPGTPGGSPSGTPSASPSPSPSKSHCVLGICL